MVSFEAVINQLWLMMQTVLVGLIFVALCIAFYIKMKYKYVVERNAETGSGVLVSRHMAKLVDQGTKKLVTFFGGEIYPMPDKKYVYKENSRGPFGKKFLVRFAIRGDGETKEPMFLGKPSKIIGAVIGKKTEYSIKDVNSIDVEMTESSLKSVPQNLRFLHMQGQKHIEKSYENAKNFMDKYGQIIGIGILIVGFIFGAIYLVKLNQQMATNAPEIISQCLKEAKTIAS